MNRKKIVAGNWKMNTTVKEGVQLAESVRNNLPTLPEHVNVIVGVPFPHLVPVSEALKGSPIKVSAQNCHQHTSGAYTGEVSAKMIADCGVQYVILGHSERRQYFGEDNEILTQKINTALAEGLNIIFCIGEALEARENNQHEAVVADQLQALYQLDAELFKRIILAYEPVWAIGTGKTASAQQAQDMHAFIRTEIAKKFGAAVADNTTILYGGSCNAGNANELFAQLDVDGGLIGGASLKADDFIKIIEARINN